MTFSWDNALRELERRREFARRLGGERRISRAHDQGRYTIRERIAKVAESFYEVVRNLRRVRRRWREDGRPAGQLRLWGRTSRYGAARRRPI